jgi:hypothetical protein
LRRNRGTLKWFCVVLCVVTCRFDPYRQGVKRLSFCLNPDMKVEPGFTTAKCSASKGRRALAR